MEVIVVASRHPCIKCLKTYEWAKEAAETLSKEIVVKKLLPGSSELEKFGKIEDAKTIAQIEKIEDPEEEVKRINQEIAELRQDEERNWALIEEKIRQLDEVLKHIKKEALERGYIVTPVLIVNGKIKSAGYLPKKEQIRQWIEEEYKQYKQNIQGG